MSSIVGFILPSAARLSARRSACLLLKSSSENPNLLREGMLTSMTRRVFGGNCIFTSSFVRRSMKNERRRWRSVSLERPSNFQTVFLIPALLRHAGRRNAVVSFFMSFVKLVGERREDRRAVISRNENTATR